MADRMTTVKIHEGRLARVAELVYDARISRFPSVSAAVDAARAARPEDAVGPGISKSTWENVEKGIAVRGDKWADIERLFRWPHGSIRRYVDDGLVEPAPQEEVTVEQQPTDTGQSLTARFGQLSADEQALVDAMIETLRRRH